MPQETEFIESQYFKTAYSEFMEILSKQAWDNISKKEFPIDSFKTFIRDITLEKPRSFSILAYSYADDFLRDVLEERLNLHAPKIGTELCQASGSLGTSLARLKLFAGLGWINRETYKNMNVIRKIRNHFAHNIYCHDFITDPIKSWINEIPPLEDKIFEIKRHGSPTYPMPIWQGDDQAKARIIICLSILILDARIGPEIRSLNIDPAEFQKSPAYSKANEVLKTGLSHSLILGTPKFRDEFIYNKNI